jgi:hypothetical protein
LAGQLWDVLGDLNKPISYTIKHFVIHNSCSVLAGQLWDVLRYLNKPISYTIKLS